MEGSDITAAGGQCRPVVKSTGLDPTVEVYVLDLLGNSYVTWGTLVNFSLSIKWGY